MDAADPGGPGSGEGGPEASGQQESGEGDAEVSGTGVAGAGAGSNEVGGAGAGSNEVGGAGAGSNGVGGAEAAEGGTARAGLLRWMRAQWLRARQWPRAPWSRKRKVLAWTAGGLAGVALIAFVAACLVYVRLNGNIHQVDVSGMLGSRPVNLHPKAENILVIGSDTRHGQARRYGTVRG
jgi:hypothetical protein